MSLLEFCKTDRQRETIQIYESCGFNAAETAKKLNLGASTVKESINRVKSYAAKKGYAPETYQESGVPAPEGFIHSFSTVQVNKEGEVERTWLRFKNDLQKFKEDIQEAIKEFYETIPESIQNYSKIDSRDYKDYDTDLIPWIQIGDAHLGMLAHAMEVGKNFDLKIAERELMSAISTLIDRLPNCERCVINDLGDFTHYENFSATTEASDHDLDFDTRFPKMIKVYSRVMRFIVDKALSKFKYVDVIINQGNHSRTNDIWMAELLRVHYGPSGRVNVLNNDSVFITYRMGNTFVMVHHSDKCKPNRLASVMATDYSKDWGESKFRYIDIGHIHHNMILKEHPGVTIESFNTLAPMDKWAHDSGYRSRQSITAVLRSKKYGCKGRIVLPIEEVVDTLNEEFGFAIPTEKTSYTV